jgi:phage regulator Rha-like protein
MGKTKSSVPAERIEQAILLIRGKKVMLDRDLAELYGVEIRVLNQAVHRNIKRFPEDFMFQLTKEEDETLRSQIVTLKKGRGQHRKYLPYAFTEQGVAMLSSVLNSERAIEVNVEIMRAFVRLRKILSSHADLARKLAALENKYDEQFKVVFDAIRALMAPPEKSRKQIGFQLKERRATYSTRKKRKKK